MHLISGIDSCVAFNELISSFQYCIASRYHSIVHGLKNGVPCIAIGWAIKYESIMKNFELDDYVFNVTKDISNNRIENAIIEMNDNYKKIGNSIIKHLQVLQNHNVFDRLPNK